MTVLVILGRKCIRWPRRVLTLVSHVEYAPRALSSLEKKYTARSIKLSKEMVQTDRRTDGHRTDTLRLTLHTAYLINRNVMHYKVYKARCYGACCSCLFHVSYRHMHPGRGANNCCSSSVSS